MALTSGKEQASIGAVSPLPAGWRSHEWDGGRFLTAHRDRTALVEGSILLPDHVVMVTLRGGALRHETVSACGERTDGPDRAGLASFLPAGCERRLRLHDVCWQWGSIALRPEIVERLRPPGAAALRPFSNRDDAFLFGLVREFERLHAEQGGLDTVYCDAMATALVHYLHRREGAQTQTVAQGLPAWKLRRVRDYVDAHLDQDIRIASLAALAGVSEGHFHRVFRATTGQTPLQFVNQQRVEAAKRILAQRAASIADLALQVGFLSPSHFARTFRELTGRNPSQFRREFEAG